MSQLKDADALVGDKTRALYDIWRECAGDRFAPRRADITLARVRALTPWMWTADVVDDGADFRLRMAGHEMLRFVGTGFAERPLSQLPPGGFLRQLTQALAHGTQQGRPAAFGPAPSAHKGKEHWEVELVVLPLSEDGKAVSGLVGMLQVWPLGTHAPAAIS